MATRSVDAPEGHYSSTAEAAKFLGLTVAEFRGEARDYAHLLPVTKFGTRDKYYWFDLVGYSWYRQKMTNPQEISASPAVPGDTGRSRAVSPRSAPEK